MDFIRDFLEATSDPNDKAFNKRVIIIFIIIFTEVLGFSIILPVLPFLGISLGLSNFQIGLIASIFSICQLISAPIAGKLSDRFGRKPILLLTQASTVIGFLLLGFSFTVWILIAARVVDGLLGSNLTVSQAYISDVTSEKNRTKVYGYSSAIFGAGLIFGPLLGGLLSIFNYSIPMFLAAGISLASLVLILIFLPESLSEKKSEFKISIHDIIPFKETKRFLKDSKVRGILISFFLYNFGFTLFVTSFALFAETQIHLGSSEMGFYFTWLGILRVIFQILLIAPLLKRFKENNVLKVGILAMIGSMVLLAFSFNYWIVFLPLTFLALGTGVSRPIYTSKLTKSVEKEETGSILGVNASLTSIVQILAPIVGGLLLDYLASPIFPAVSAVIFTLILISWYWTLKPGKKLENASVEK